MQLRLLRVFPGSDGRDTLQPVAQYDVRVLGHLPQHWNSFSDHCNRKCLAKLANKYGGDEAFSLRY